MESILLRVALLLVMFTGILSADEANCAKRNLNFKNRDHYKFTVSGTKGNFIKALKGSDTILKGRKGNNISIALSYVYDRQHDLDNGGFKGKVCFRVQGACAIDILWAGIPYCSISCSKKQLKKLYNYKRLDSINDDAKQLKISCEESCLGGGSYHDKIEIKEKKRGSSKKYCVKAIGNAQLSLGLIADGDKRVQVQKFYIKACEVISKVTYMPANSVSNEINAEEKINDTILVPEEKINGTIPEPEEKINGTIPVPEEKINGTIPVPEEKINGTIPEPEEKINGTIPVPEEKINGTIPVPEEKINGTIPVPEEKINGTIPVEKNYWNKTIP